MWDLKHNVVHVNYSICESAWYLKHTVVHVNYYISQCQIWNIM